MKTKTLTATILALSISTAIGCASTDEMAGTSGYESTSSATTASTTGSTTTSDTSTSGTSAYGSGAGATTGATTSADAGVSTGDDDDSFETGTASSQGAGTGTYGATGTDTTGSTTGATASGSTGTTASGSTTGSTGTTASGSTTGSTGTMGSDTTTGSTGTTGTMAGGSTTGSTAGTMHGAHHGATTGTTAATGTTGTTGMAATTGTGAMGTTGSTGATGTTGATGSTGYTGSTAATTGATTGSTPVRTAGDASDMDDGAASGGAMQEGEVLAMLMVLDEHEVAAASQASGKKPSEKLLALVTKVHGDHSKNLAADKKLSGVTASNTARVSEHRQKHAADRTRLGAMSGAAYEKAFLDAMIKDHTEALSLIDKQMMPAVTNAGLKAHLTATRAVIAGHLEEARTLKASMG